LPIAIGLLISSMTLLLVTPHLQRLYPDLLGPLLRVFAVAYLLAWLFVASIVLFNRPAGAVPPTFGTSQGRSMSGAAEAHLDGGARSVKSSTIAP
jgi:hypothetical protein